MTDSPLDADESRLNFAEISTHHSALDDRNRLVLRYSEAILAYATALLGGSQDAEDIHMQIVHNMLEGKFHKDVKQGSFRFFVKRAVHHAVINHLVRRSRWQNLLRRLKNTLLMRQDKPGSELRRLAISPPAEAELEEAELSIWRSAVLKQAIEGSLKALSEYEQMREERAQPNVYHTLACLLIDHPGAGSEQIAKFLSDRNGGVYNAGQVRGIEMRMRKKLAELLIAEIIPQVEDPSIEAVFEELSSLGLLAYVEPYLSRSNDA